MERETLCLEGVWRFLLDPYMSLAEQGVWRQDRDVRYWREVAVPSCFEACAPGLAFYEGGGWFRREFHVPKTWAGRHIVLHFDAVNYHAKAWLNDVPLGEYQDPFLPFELDSSDAVRPGEQNTLVVAVDNYPRKGEVPGEQVGWRAFGGILRGVWVESRSLVHIDDIALEAAPTDGGGRVSVGLTARNNRGEPAQVTVMAGIRDGSGTLLATWERSSVAVPGGGEVDVELVGSLEGVVPWSPEQPVLYTLEIQLRMDGRVVDTQRLRVGFRTIEATGGRLLLNGEPIYLTGFNRHDDSPRTDAARDLSLAREDLLAMKRAGVNFVRLCHYPHDAGVVDLCDEIGLLAMCEIPLYWWNGLEEGEENCARKLKAAKRQLRGLIGRDRNHPAVIFWSVSNETHEEHPEVAEGNRELVCMARSIDPTRLAVHVSHRWRDHPNFAEDDVICINSYPSLAMVGGFQTRTPGVPAYSGDKAKGFWQEALAALHEQYPDKPILVTEFGYCSIEGTFENAFGEDVMAEMLPNEFAGMDAPYVCGATIWCWADHAWPAGAFVNGLAISPFGVVSRERRRGPAYEAVQAMFHERHGRPVPASEERDDSLFMIRETLDDIPIVPFPEGFQVRTLRPAEGHLWTDIVRESETLFDVHDGLFAQQFGDNVEATTWRCFVVENAEGGSVATATAWYHPDFHGERWGRLHWVAVRRPYQKRGIGRALISYALRRMAEWHDRCFLDTQIPRTPALKLYLDFGFLPDLEQPGAVDRWRKVLEALDHHVLRDVIP